jgi:hypothetical protein
MIYLLGPILEDNDAFLQIVEFVGKLIDEMNRRADAHNFKETKLLKNTTPKEKLII